MKQPPVHQTVPLTGGLLFFLVLACAFFFSSAALAQEPADETTAADVATKEYFIPQQAGEALAVRVSAYEAAFTSRLVTEEGDLIAHSGLPDARMLPVYQYIGDSGASRQIDITVMANQVTDRTEFELEIIRLNFRDDRSTTLAAGYRLLADGIELLPGGNIPAYTVKIQTLLRAASVFDELGMQEMKLWSNVFASHLILHKLRDPQIAMEWAKELLETPRIERFATIHFAALKLRSSALILSDSGGGDQPEQSPLQLALQETRAAAQKLDYKLEEAITLLASGVDLNSKGVPGAALERLRESLEISEAIGATDLSEVLQQQIALIQGEPEDSQAGIAVPDETDWAQAEPDRGQLESLAGTLPADSAVLSFQVNDSVARGSIADASGVQSWNLEDADEIRALCAAARQALQTGDWAAFDRVTAPLGDGLLGSLPVALPETIFLSAQGALAGIPFDALVFDGERLAARHRVVNLASLQGLSSNGADLRFPAPESVFLAGDPRDWTGDFALRLDPSDEVRAVSERFVGPGLHVVQGVSLLQDEFTGGEYGQADLVHLSIPGSVGLSTAPGSKLVLSEPGRDAGREEMNAETLAGMATRAGLVFFSRTEFSGVGNTGNTDLGVVSAVLNAGARAVIASLWRVQDTARNRMVSGFYDQLQDERDLATALAIAKRDYMQTEAGLDWASFQLFLN